MSVTVEKKEITTPHDPNTSKVVLYQATFSPEELEPVIFYSPLGSTAHQYLQSLKSREQRLVFGGIYFKNQQRMGYSTRTPDGFVFYQPHQKKGETISEMAAFQTGGFLLFDTQGSASLVRKDQFNLQSQGTTTFVCTPGEGNEQTCKDIQSYRLIVQSNIVLVHNGHEDGNNATDSAWRAALGIEQQGQVIFVATETSVTLKEFGDLLLALGVKEAINLDGHTSAQAAERNPDGTINDWFARLAEPMPLLFTVRKSK